MVQGLAWLTPQVMATDGLKGEVLDTVLGREDRGAMEGFGGVLVLSMVMLLGSYLAGSIPLFIALSEEKLQVRLWRCCPLAFNSAHMHIELSNPIQYM